MSTRDSYLSFKIDPISTGELKAVAKSTRGPLLAAPELPYFPNKTLFVLGRPFAPACLIDNSTHIRVLGHDARVWRFCAAWMLLADVISTGR